MKWIKDLNVRPETIKLLEENIVKRKFDINYSGYLFGSYHKGNVIKAKINKWNLIKLNSFITAKENINNTKRKPTEWDKIFANGMTYNSLLYNIYKQLIQLTIKKTNLF